MRVFGAHGLDIGQSNLLLRRVFVRNLRRAPRSDRIGYETRLYGLLFLLDLRSNGLYRRFNSRHGVRDYADRRFVAWRLRSAYRLDRTIFQIPQYHTESMLFLSYPISWVVTFLMHCVCYYYMRRRLPKNDGESARFDSRKVDDPIRVRRLKANVCH